MPTEFQYFKSLPAFSWLIFISTEVSHIMPRIYSYKYSFNISLLQVVVYNWSAWCQELNSKSTWEKRSKTLWSNQKKTPIKFSSLRVFRVFSKRNQVHLDLTFFFFNN